MFARAINCIAPAEYAPVSESNDELDELPLGRLISLLRKVLPGSNVLSDLERLRPERNHCAHRALVLCFISDVSDVISLEKEFRRLCNTRQLAWSSFEAFKPQLAAAEKGLRRFERTRLILHLIAAFSWLPTWRGRSAWALYRPDVSCYKRCSAPEVDDPTFALS
jgi:hypothetical protein